MVLFNYFNRNAKVLSIGKIEIEIENGEDITGPNPHRSISPVAPSQLVSLRNVPTVVGISHHSDKMATTQIK